MVMGSITPCPLTVSGRATMSIAVDVTMNVLDGFGKGGDVLETLRSSPPSILRKLCERMGATYIKVGAQLENAIEVVFRRDQA